MAEIRAFRAVRPAEGSAAKVAALPYDVYSREEAAAFVKNHPQSFLNIDRPETAFPPDHDMYGADVYQHAKDSYEAWKAAGIFVQEKEKCFYLYELCMNGRSQTGLVALSSVDDYLNGVCKKHENTVAEKEADRIRHVDTLSAQTGPIFLSYHHSQAVDEVTEAVKRQAPLYDFVAEDGIRHRVWRIADEKQIQALVEAFAALGCTYIADGHHRAASAVKVALERRAENPKHTGQEEYNYFLSVLFPDTELRIYDYNRVVRDLNGWTVPEFLGRLSDVFDGEEVTAPAQTEETCQAAKAAESEQGSAAAPWEDGAFWRPREKGELGMYLDGSYYRLHLKPEIAAKRAADPVASLDVAALQDLVLSPLLGIGDPRTDKRIRFVGGIRGLAALTGEVDRLTAAEGKSAVAFAMYPTSMAELFRVADAGLLMPPKSTWFEPKLRSGLFIHEF